MTSFHSVELIKLFLCFCDSSAEGSLHNIGEFDWSMLQISRINIPRCGEHSNERIFVRFSEQNIPKETKEEQREHVASYLTTARADLIRRTIWIVRGTKTLPAATHEIVYVYSLSLFCRRLDTLQEKLPRTS